MSNNLNSIANRLTPSVPMEITFAAQPASTGRKITTLFGHRSATGGNGIDYAAYNIVNVGDPAACKAEVEAMAGTASQISLMAEAFVKANSDVASPRNFPAFRVVLIPNAELHFGPLGEAIDAVKTLRSDMLVSCYPASDTTNLATLQALKNLISGIDRDLQGQFGSFIQVASIEELATQVAYAANDRGLLSACLPDTNTANIAGLSGDVATGSNKIINMPSTVGVNIGAVITAIGVPTSTVVEEVTANSITMSANATGTHVAEAVACQNVVSQASEIIASAHAAAVMASAFPYNPLQSVTVGGLIPPRKQSDWIEIDPNGESESALAAGLSPLYIQPGNTVGLIRTRTTYTTLPGNVPVTAYFDWQELVALYDFREVIYSVSQNPPFNNNPGGTKASRQIARKFKDEVLRNAKLFEDLGCFENVKELAPLFIVEPSQTSRGRFDFKIPVEVLPGLTVIAGNIQAVADLQSFLAFSV